MAICDILKIVNEILGVFVMKTLFLDESGRTGTQKYNGKWNFDQQPYFILSGLIVPNDNVDVLNNYIKEMALQFKVQGGEIKFSNKGVQNKIEKIIERIIDIQNKLQCQLLLEIVNKKYCIAIVITEYCVVPYYRISKDLIKAGIVIDKQCIANYIYEVLSDELLGECVDFFDSGIRDVSSLVSICRKLQEELKNAYIIENIEKTIITLENHMGHGLLERHCLPLQDRYRGGTSSVAVCPHVDSFNNIVNRAVIQGINKVVHDNIKELEEALQYNVTDRLNIKSPNFLEFKDSKEYPVIQIVDIWAGYIGNAIKKKLSNESLSVHTTNVISKDLNFVSSFNEQVKMFPYNHDILFRKLCYDIFKGK